jgi:divalent metal cation (Fe/Co/Zn/Cd) transporter
MFIFFAISTVLIFAIHKSVMKSVDNYNYGHGSYEEWREFEKQFQYEDAFKF